MLLPITWDIGYYALTMDCWTLEIAGLNWNRVDLNCRIARQVYI